jgi:hypothetical protein
MFLGNIWEQKVRRLQIYLVNTSTLFMWETIRKTIRCKWQHWRFFQCLADLAGWGNYEASDTDCEIVTVVKKPLADFWSHLIIAYIVLSFKNSDKSNVSNHRGVSILLAIPKLFEKKICNVITPITCPSISDELHDEVKVLR